MTEPAPATTESATIDPAALAALAATPLTWADKGIAPALWGLTPAEVAARGVGLRDLPTPLVTLSAAGIARNVATMAGWCAERGVELAPHGKTTMAPQLWAAQLAAGAWAITVANLPQLAVARAYGVSRVLVANQLLDPVALGYIAEQLAADPAAQVLCWADDPRAVALMEQGLAGAAARLGDRFRPLDVLVELGEPGGRTGARSVATGLEVGAAVAAAPHLRLAGVGGYEGVVAAGSAASDLTAVRGFLGRLGTLHERLLAAGHYPDQTVPVVTAGGSAYFDEVVDVLEPQRETGARVVLRSGAYLTHDDGHYRRLSPLGEQPRTAGEGLVGAVHGWVRVSSRAEPGLSLVDGGKRDLPYDLGLPTVQGRRGDRPGDPLQPVTGLRLTAVNDQHGFVADEGERSTPLAVGDVLRLGLSHPCTAFDKWRVLPVLDDADAADPVVVDVVRTFF